MHPELASKGPQIPPQRNLCLNQLKGKDCEPTCSYEHAGEARLDAAIQFNELTGSTGVCAYGASCTGACTKARPPRFHLEESPNVNEAQVYAKYERAEKQLTPKEVRAAKKASKVKGKPSKSASAGAGTGASAAEVKVDPSDPLRSAFNSIQKKKSDRVEYFFNLRKITLNESQRLAATKIIEDIVAKETAMFEELSALAVSV